MKKLKLEKSTIANLNDSSMDSVFGGGTTGCTLSICGSCNDCYTETICGASDYNPTCNCVTNDNPCV